MLILINALGDPQLAEKNSADVCATVRRNHQITTYELSDVQVNYGSV